MYDVCLRYMVYPGVVRYVAISSGSLVSCVQTLNRLFRRCFAFSSHIILTNSCLGAVQIPKLRLEIRASISPGVMRLSTISWSLLFSGVKRSVTNTNDIRQRYLPCDNTTIEKQCRLADIYPPDFGGSRKIWTCPPPLVAFLSQWNLWFTVYTPQTWALPKTDYRIRKTVIVRTVSRILN